MIRSRLSRRDLLGGVAASTALGAIPSATARPPDAAMLSLTNALVASNGGRVVFPGEAEHAKIKYYNGRTDCVRTMAFVRPTSAAGVQAFVRWAAANNRTFAIRGGGHSFEGKSSHPDLVLDMSLMRKPLMLNRDGTLDVAAGVLISDIYDMLSPRERVLPAGTCPTVGIVGHTLGGGIGDFLPMYGFAAQCLMEVEIVTMTGQVLRISEDGIAGEGAPTNVDPRRLMRLLRGAGQGSIGIVTSMKLNTHDVRNARLASFKLEGSDISARRIATIIEIWQRWRTETRAMHSLVSSKLNLGRSGSNFDCEIAGLIAIPSGNQITVDAIRRSLDPLFATSELRKRSFAPRINAAGAVKTFIDTNETTHNPKRKNLYGASSALPAALPRLAIDHLVRGMSADDSISIYTAGGVSKTGVETCLHPCEFIVEWTIYADKPKPEYRQRIADLRTATVGRNDLGFPNYPDGLDRNYFTDGDWIAKMRERFDPKFASASSLLSPAPPRAECR